MAAEELIETELMLNRFHRLIGELIRGFIGRNTFQPWEVQILLDIYACKLPRRKSIETIRQYQRAVDRQLQSGPGPPMKLSEYLEMRTRRRENEINRE